MALSLDERIKLKYDAEEHERKKREAIKAQKESVVRSDAELLQIEKKKDEEFTKPYTKLAETVSKAIDILRGDKVDKILKGLERQQAIDTLMLILMEAKLTRSFVFLCNSCELNYTKEYLGRRVKSESGVICTICRLNKAVSKRDFKECKRIVR